MHMYAYIYECDHANKNLCSNVSRQKQSQDMDCASLLVQKAPPGEGVGGGGHHLGEQKALPMMLSDDGKSSCFTFGRCV